MISTTRIPLFLLKMIDMKNIYLIGLLTAVLFQSCAQNASTKSTKEDSKIEITKLGHTFSLGDFLAENDQLTTDTDRIFAALDDTAIVAQLIMPAVGRLGLEHKTIQDLVKQRLIGGVLMLNGTKEEFTTWINTYEQLNSSIGNLPFLYSADAEPSLVNRKITGSTPVKKANELKSINEVNEVAKTISADLKAIGINYNFSPVVDMSPNKTVGFRSFGAVPANIIPWSNAFIQTTQAENIIATAKHFPGHGLVSGDTHKSLQVIDGELKEIGNYPELIKNGVLSIMIAHIAVKNNDKYDTKGLPASTSEIIVSQLLRNEYGFKGLIVTDAMNMGGVSSLPQCEVKAIEAGCDIALMPVDSKKAHKEILAKYNTDPAFKAKVNVAAKRVIRMKIALGLIK